jgi:hypothetical protein
MLFEPAIEEKQFYPRVEAFEFIAQKDDRYRTVSLEPSPNYTTPTSVYPANTQMIYGIYDIRNYDAMETDHYWKLLNIFTQGMMMFWIDPSHIDERFLDSVGIKWVFSRSDLPSGNTSRSYSLIKDYGYYSLFENKDAMPRAFLVYNATFSSNDSEILETLKDTSFDGSSHVILYGCDEQIKHPITGTQSRVEIADYQPNSIKIKAVSSDPGFLVLSDTYYPGWNAYVNGDKVEILRANLAFRAVKLSGGKNVVEFKYMPMSFGAGALISLLSMLIIIAKFMKLKRAEKGRGLCHPRVYHKKCRLSKTHIAICL